MSTANSRTKSHKSMKVARFVIDVLAVYQSDTATPISQDAALKSLQEQFSSKKPPSVKKCVMQILHKQSESYSIVLKSKEKNTVLETFSLNSIGLPSSSQMTVAKYKAQSLVFLPVLNNSNKAELFIFHPYSVTAQEVVIKLARLLENRRDVLIDNNSGVTHQNEIVAPVNNSLRNPETKIERNDNTKVEKRRQLDRAIVNREFSDQGDTRSICSISSNFINNWYGKLDTITSLQPNSTSSIASINEELYLLNQNLKEIREFMNQLFKIVRLAVQDKRQLKQETSNQRANGHQYQVVHLPPRVEVIEIIEKIKTSINLAAAHKDIIINPPSEEIVNQLFLFLRILGDATMDDITRNPELVSGVKYPLINSSTVKFLTHNLNAENSHYWQFLGFNYGFINYRGSLPNYINRSAIDEFEIKKVQDSSEDERKPTVATSKQQKYSTQRESPTPLVDSDMIYRTFPRTLYDSDKKAPLFMDNENLQYQKSASRSNHSICNIHSNYSTWDDRQCRFIDAVQLRNGRLGKIIGDRSAQNYRELAVSHNEIVEILKDYGDTVSIKNALGEIGHCPKTVVSELANQSY